MHRSQEQPTSALTQTQLAHALGITYTRLQKYRKQLAHTADPFPEPRRGRGALYFDIAAVRPWLAQRHGKPILDRGRTIVDIDRFDSIAGEYCTTAERIRETALRIAAQEAATAGEPIARDLTSTELSFALARDFGSFVQLRNAQRDFPRPKRIAGQNGNALFYDPVAVRDWLVSHDHDVRLYDLRVRSILARPAQQDNNQC